MRILIAEDDCTSRTMLAAILGKQGYEVIEAVNGVAALEALQQPEAPRLAILDWLMPEMDGLEVIRRIRALQTANTQYLIMLTSMGAKNDIIKGLDAGANDYLTKPFDPDELQARIEVGRRMVELQDELIKSRALLANKVDELSLALEQIKTLRGIVPICSNCKKIRNDKGYWQQVEVYVHNHTEAEFTHGICPDCIQELYPDLYSPDDDMDKTPKED
jgi:sigma-B regulation protein RsbU (phosphoserine phosphatase)